MVVAARDGRGSVAPAIAAAPRPRAERRVSSIAELLLTSCDSVRIGSCAGDPAGGEIESRLVSEQAGLSQQRPLKAILMPCRSAWPTFWQQASIYQRHGTMDPSS